MDNFLETIGGILYDAGIKDESITNSIDIIKESYTLVTWPDIQLFMEEDWFDDEAILETEGRFGSSAYFIPTKYIIK